jgi:hypothetical protein
VTIDRSCGPEGCQLDWLVSPWLEKLAINAVMVCIAPPWVDLIAASYSDIDAVQER